MSASVYEAAQQLLTELAAPAGRVNTLGQRTGPDSVIRVLVDPEYWYLLGSIPSKFEGYEVRVERRGQISP